MHFITRVIFSATPCKGWRHGIRMSGSVRRHKKPPLTAVPNKRERLGERRDTGRKPCSETVRSRCAVRPVHNMMVVGWARMGR